MIIGAPIAAHIPSRCSVGAVFGGRCTYRCTYLMQVDSRCCIWWQVPSQVHILHAGAQ